MAELPLQKDSQYLSIICTVMLSKTPDCENGAFCNMQEEEIESFGRYCGETA